MEGRLDLLVRKAFEHHTHHAQVDPGLAGDRHEFVVLAHLPVAPDPPGARRLCAPQANGAMRAGSPAAVAAAPGPHAVTAPVHRRAAQRSAGAPAQASPRSARPTSAMAPERRSRPRSAPDAATCPPGAAGVRGQRCGPACRQERPPDHHAQRQTEGIDEQVAFAPGALPGASWPRRTHAVHRAQWS